MRFQFQYTGLIWLLAGLAILIILFLALLQWKKKITRRIGDEKWVTVLISNHSSRLFLLKFILVSLAFILGVLAVMNPRKPEGPGAVSRKGIDIAIALDVSKSMLAADPAPNRLERARQFISKLMNAMPDDRFALILFAGKAYLQMPLTTDHGAAQLFVSSASPDAVPQQGTVISDALEMSARAFDATDKKFKTVVMITDGEDHDEEAVTTAKALSKQGVMVNTVGIGSPEGATFTDPATGELKKDESGNTVVSKLNEDILKELAKETNGIYIRLRGTDEALTALSAQLSQIDKKAFTDWSQVNFKTYFMWLAAAMFILLLAENFIPERKKPVLA